MLVRFSLLLSTVNGTSTSSTASPRPAHAAAIVAWPGRPVSFHIPARSIRPPSSGRPGSRLNTPTTRLARISWSISTRGIPPRLNATFSPQPHPASASEVSGPTTETANSRAGVGGSCSISEKPPSGYSRIRRTVSPKARATTQWLSSCTSTEAYSRMTKVAATSVPDAVRVYRRRQAAGVEHDHQSGHQEPVRRDVHRHAEGPRDDDAIPAVEPWRLRRADFALACSGLMPDT